MQVLFHQVRLEHRLLVIFITIGLLAMLFIAIPNPAKAETVWDTSTLRLVEDAPGNRYIYAPATVVDGNTEHVWSCYSEFDNVIKDSIFYFRRVNGVIVERKVVMRASASGWDSVHVCDPSVVGGRFTYAGTTYNYAMFYLGNDVNASAHNQVGVAFANDLAANEWVKYPQPIVPFPANTDPGYWGTGQPAATSVDGNGRLLLFYRQNDTNGATQYRRDINLSNMNSPVIGAALPVTTSGLTGNVAALLGSDLMYDGTRDRFYAVRDRHIASGYPDFITESVDVVSIPASAIWSGGGTWTTEAIIDPSVTGFPRSHNSGLKRTIWGGLPSSNTIEVMFADSCAGSCGTAEWSYDLWEIKGTILNTNSVTTTLFYSGFENGEPLPTWENTIDIAGGGANNVGGICCGLTSMETGRRVNELPGSNALLMYSGYDNSNAVSYSYMQVFTVNIPVTGNTTLSYWIYPQSSGLTSGNNSTCVAVDMVMDNGVVLRNTSVTDQRGNRVHPAWQCGKMPVNNWTNITANIGTALNGRTIQHIMVGYDQPGNTGGYRGYINDLLIYNKPTGVSADAQIVLNPSSTPTTAPVLQQRASDTIGIYKDGIFYLKTSNTSGNADLTVQFGGAAAQLPVAGDWNGDGVDTIGVYDTLMGIFSLRDSNTAGAADYEFVFGNPGDLPLSGRWDKVVAQDSVGVYRSTSGIFYGKLFLSLGDADYWGIFGNPGDTPVAGDWDGDGLDSIGVYRAGSGYWYLSNNSAPTGLIYSDLAVGWRGDPLSIAIAGDWMGSGQSGIGFYDATDRFMLRTTAQSSVTASTFSLTFGMAGGQPVVGRWSIQKPAALNGILVGRGQSGSLSDGADHGAD